MTSFLQIMLILLTFVYVIGGIFWFVRHLIGYLDDRGVRYSQQSARDHARKCILTPVWIFFAAYYIAVWAKEMWKDSGLSDDIKKLQKEK